KGNGTVVHQRLYQLIREQGSIRDRTIEITFLAPGAEAYYFTFGYRCTVDPERARELLTAERARIERSLRDLRHVDTGEDNDYAQDPINLASELYEDELDEGLSDDLRRQLQAVERAEARLAAGTYGLSGERG